jgi:hypothetical protein
MSVIPVPRQRRHTLYFLTQIRPFSPVFLDTDADMTRVLAHRRAAAAGGLDYSIVTYIVYAASRALARHPEANAAFRGSVLRPRVARYKSVSVKLTLDKVIDGQRVVMAALLPAAEVTDLGELQRQIARYRDGDAGLMPEFAPARALHKMPSLLGAALFQLAARPLGRRPSVFGTLAITSLGHAPVDGFYSVGGTTITLGVGHVTDRPVVRDGQLTAAPLMRLCLTFDHRVIDGAEAADLLTEIKSALEGFEAPGGPLPGRPAGAEPRSAAQAPITAGTGHG